MKASIQKPHGERTPEQAAQDYAKRVSILKGKVFVQLAVYADESEHHDTNPPGGVIDFVICGIIATAEDWNDLCLDWTAVLNEFGVPYFHFREWTAARRVARGGLRNSGFERNIYRDLKEKALNEFLCRISKAAKFQNKLVCPITMPVKTFKQLKTLGKVPAGISLYEFGMTMFFEGCVATIEKQRPLWKGQPISFFFDQGGKIEVWNAIMTAYRNSISKTPEFVECVAADDVKTPPLQAADMVVYRIRQLAARKPDSTELAYGPWPEIDQEIAKLLLSFQPTA